MCIPDYKPTLKHISLLRGDPNELPSAEIIKLYKSATQALIFQSKVFAEYLRDNKEGHVVNTYEKVEFIILINILSRIQTLLSLLNAEKSGIFFFICLNRHGKKVITELSEDRLFALKNDISLSKSCVLLLRKSYLSLIDYLKTSAFLLQEMPSFTSLNQAIDNIVYVSDQIQIAEQLGDYSQMKSRIEQCIVMIDIIIEEHCLFNPSCEEAVLMRNWCRFVKGYDNKKSRYNSKNIRDLLELRSLFGSKLKSIEGKY